MSLQNYGFSCLQDEYRIIFDVFDRKNKFLAANSNYWLKMFIKQKLETIQAIEFILNIVIIIFWSKFFCLEIKTANYNTNISNLKVYDLCL